MPHFTAITVDRFINTGASNSVDRPNQGTRTVLKASSTNSKPWDYLRLEKRYSLPSTRRPVLENTTEINADAKGSGSHGFASESSSRVWRTSSDSIISELGNGVIINECQVGCSNLEKGVAVEEGKNDVRNGHTGEDGCEMPSTGSHGVASESSSHVWLTTSDSISSEHVNDAITDECQIGCINLENGIVVEEGNDDVRNGHLGEDVCEMPSIDSLGSESDSEDLCVPHDSVWLTASDSIISEHMNVAIVNESQIGCINLEDGISVEEENDVRNAHIGEDVCEVPSTDSLGRMSDSEDLCVPHDSVWLTASDSIISEHMNVAIVNDSQIRCTNLENGIAVEEGNDDVRNCHIEEDVCEMPSTYSLSREIDSEDVCVPHDSVCLTASGSIISEHVNDVIINECHIECINLENGIAVGEGDDDIRNGHIGKDVCEMPSTDSLGSESDSEDLCVPHDSVWLTASDSIISENVNDAIIDECQIGCIHLENGIAVEEGNDDVRNGHLGEDVCEMPSTDALGRESDSEDEHVNDLIIDECQIGCFNLENGISVEERNDDVRNGHIGEDVFEMPSTDSLGKKSDSEDLCVPHDTVCLTASGSITSEHVNDAITDESQIGCIHLGNGIAVEEGNDDVINGHIGDDVCEIPSTDSLGSESDSEDLCDCHDLVSSYTTLKDREEECEIFSSLATPTPGVEFYDAWEELSSIQNSVKAALEEELLEIRMSLAIETETRNQAEKALENMQRRWERMREQLSLIGLTLPSSSGNEATNSDPAEEMVSQQVQVIRFVSESIGRGIGKAEAVTEMEDQVQAKNFEITRLCDRLHYYKAVNREMSERNQQVAAEGTRRLGKRRKWRQRWIWGSIGVTISIGVVAVACNYLQTGKSSSIMHCSIEE